MNLKVEHLSDEQTVGGSSPSTLTKEFNIKMNIFYTHGYGVTVA